MRPTQALRACHLNHKLLRNRSDSGPRVSGVIEERTVRRVRAAAVIVALEAAAALAFGIAELVRLDPSRLSVGITTGAFFFLYAVGLGAAARAVARLSSWSRGPIVLAQLIQLGVAWSFHGRSTDWVALLLAVPALVVLVVVLAPATTDAFYGARQTDEDDPVSSR